MLYCGITLNEYHSNNRNTDFVFDDPYTALNTANKKWEADTSHDDISRLLVVLRKENGVVIEEDVAFFQFENAQSVKDFIAGKQDIVWSQEDDPKWDNGDSKIMPRNN